MSGTDRSWKKRLGMAAYLFVFLILCLVVAEMGARFMGLGDPILYYNSTLGGLRPLPDQQVTRLGDASVTIDANGYRTRTSPSDSSLNVLFLGDSVTWGGSIMDDRQIFSEQAALDLEARGLSMYAMNSGVNGTSLMNQAGVYRETEERIDAVVWLFPPGDAYRAFTTAGYLWPPMKKPRYALVELIDQIIRVYWLPRFRRETQGGVHAWSRSPVPEGREDFYQSVFARRFEDNKSSFERVVADIRSKDIPLIVAVTPVVLDGDVQPLGPDAESILRSAREKGAGILDLHDPIRISDSPSSLFLDAVHFDAPGHALVGGLIADRLADLVGPRAPVDASGE